VIRRAGALSVAALVCACAMSEQMQEYQYVTDRIVVPTTATEAREQGFDIDGDSVGRPDNQIGAIVALLDLDLQTYVDDFMRDGNLILLHSVEALTLDGSSVAGWHMFLGEDTPAPDFSGGGAFEVSLESPREARLRGDVDAGHVFVDADQMELTFRLGPGEPFLTLHPLKVKIEATITPEGCTQAKIGGAISSWEVNDRIIPAVAAVLDIDADALRANPLVQNLIAPDVDLLNGEMQLAPNSDGIDDAVSFGLGMTCTSAVFVPPVE
jgi:hypothetical protein